VGTFPSDAKGVVVITNKGHVKRMELDDNDDFDDIRPSGIKYTKLKEEDADVVSVLPEREGADLILVAENGKGIRFELDELDRLSRQARGVIGKRGDSLVAGGALVDDSDTLLLQGDSTCAAVNVSDIEKQRRGGKGRFLVKAGDDAIHTVLSVSGSPKVSKDGELERFDSRSKLGGHGARQEIDHFVLNYTDDGDTRELFERD
jgi:DNA gyrase/topoisomerase IV subunit A